jgi:uncharacterized protein YhbP (UPF0306 family)
VSRYIVDDQYRDEQTSFKTYDMAIDWCNEQEIIYYGVAMNYLIDNDCSLVDSITSAHDMGCSLENINSEVLATIHYQDSLINSIKEV